MIEKNDSRSVYYYLRIKDFYSRFLYIIYKDYYLRIRIKKRIFKSKIKFLF